MTLATPLSLATIATSLLLIACQPASETRQNSANEAPHPLSIGLGRVNITPTTPMRMSGYGNRTTLSNGAAGQLWAKALAIGDENPVILVTLDLIGVPQWLRDNVVAELGMPEANIAFCASHTHAGPHLRDVLNPIFMQDFPPEHWEEIERYSDGLTEQVVKACREALADRAPGQLSWGQGNVGFAVNRRVLENGKWTGFGVQPDGPVDHSLPVLRVADAKGKLRAVFANYACHCTTLGGNFHQLHGDWAGEVQRLLEERHPGVSALIAIGCGADANPNPRGTMENVIAHAESLADEVDRVLGDEMVDLNHFPNTKFDKIRLPLDPLPTREFWEAHAASEERTAYYGQQILKRLDAGESLPTFIDYPIQTWTFGEDLAMVFLAGEVVVDYAIKLKERFDADRIWINAYANATPSYIASRRLYDEGGYEVDRSMYYYDKPVRLSPDTEDLVLDEVLKQLPHPFYSEKTLSLIPAPVPQQDALATMEVHPDLQIELVAAEPLVSDPIDIAWGPDRRMLVVEMADYPLGIDGKSQGGGRIRFLEDRDDDGVYDASTLFLDELSFPTSVLTWKDGILVTAPPDLLFARDTNDDGKADSVTTLFTGFTLGNQQHLVNGMQWGLDGWIYLANGDSGGRIQRPGSDDEINIEGRDLRIRPETGEIEAVMGRTQFGRNRDSFGNWFGNSNSWPGWHYALEDEYLNRNPHVNYASGRVFLPQEPQAGPVFPISITLSRFNDYERANRFTSACGFIIYDDSVLGEGFVGNSFVAEPVHNLVSRAVLYPEGHSFRSRRAHGEEHSEFLRSTDNWFRPTAIRNGPDGALYVVDMYRFAIEHPEWIPEDWQRKLNLREGHDRGRIYRISPRGSQRVEVPDLTRMTPSQRVGLLRSDIRWQRDLAQQLIVENEAREDSEEIRDIARHSPHAKSRIQALWTLSLIDELDETTLLQSLSDPADTVRAQAVKLSLPRIDREPILQKVTALVHDTSPFVRIQVAYALGETSDRSASEALYELAQAHPRDDLLQSAVLSSVIPHQEHLVKRLGSRILDPEYGDLFAGIVRTAMGTGNGEIVQQMLHTALDQTGEYPLENHLIAYLDFRKAQSQFPSGELASQNLNSDFQDKEVKLFQSIRASLQDPQAPVTQRLLALQTIPYLPGDPGSKAALARECLDPRNPIELQTAAVESLASILKSNAAKSLLDLWSQSSPIIRDRLIKTLLTRNAWTAELMEAASQKPELARSLSAAQKNLLTRHSDNKIRELAQRVFQQSSNSNRQAVIEKFQPALALTGDPFAGRGQFSNLCTACHRLDGIGVDVGPQIDALSDLSPESLLVAILDPNRAVESKYHRFVATTQSDETTVGIISEETGSSITLTTVGGQRQKLNRKGLKSLESTALSLMPDGLESDMSLQQMADLLAFLSASNESLKIRADENGELSLAANRAIITGPSAFYNPENESIDWIQKGDVIEWTAYDVAPGHYDIFGHAGLKDEHAGRPFTLHMNDTFVTGAVPYSRGMDRFRKRKFGNIKIDDPTPKAVFRLEHSLPHAEFALKELRLIPIK